MDFSLTGEQQLLRDTAHKLVERECPPALVRAHIDDPSVYAPLWNHLADFVALGAGPCTDLCLFLEQTGASAAPGPFLATTLYTALTHDDERTGTVALVDDPTHQFILEADRVERLAVVLPGPTLAIIDAPIALEFVPTVDYSRRLFTLVDPVTATAEPLAPERLAAWRDRAYTCIAAEMIGVARRIFDMALQYAKERKQFDVPIGSFQAIQHKLADMSLALERATSAVYYAAMTVDDAGDADSAERGRAAHVAKAAAGEATRRILKDGIQIHGGIGYTWEHDLHLYLRRATADEYLFGTTGWHHERLADLIIG